MSQLLKLELRGEQIADETRRPYFIISVSTTFFQV
jgi:hypothetical protein